jgi:hypothetical protein
MVARGGAAERESLPPPEALAPAEVAWWEHAVGPLEREGAALQRDASAVADAMWQGMPRRLRSLLGGS